MLIEQRILRTVERHLNYGMHPTAVLLPEPDYEQLLCELERYFWLAPDLQSIKSNERLVLECPHDRLLVLKRTGGKVYWQWEFKCLS